MSRIEILKKLKQLAADANERLALEEAIQALEWWDGAPTLMLEDRTMQVIRRKGFYHPPLSALPVIEKLANGRARLVVDIDELGVSTLREVFGWPVQPAPLEATEAIVRATHALAGAAIELTHVAKKMHEKL